MRQARQPLPAEPPLPEVPPVPAVPPPPTPAVPPLPATPVLAPPRPPVPAVPNVPPDPPRPPALPPAPPLPAAPPVVPPAAPAVPALPLVPAVSNVPPTPPRPPMLPPPPPLPAAPPAAPPAVPAPPPLPAPPSTPPLPPRVPAIPPLPAPPSRGVNNSFCAWQAIPATAASSTVANRAARVMTSEAETRQVEVDGANRVDAGAGIHVGARVEVAVEVAGGSGHDERGPRRHHRSRKLSAAERPSRRSVGVQLRDSGGSQSDDAAIGRARDRDELLARERLNPEKPPVGSQLHNEPAGQARAHHPFDDAGTRIEIGEPPGAPADVDRAVRTRGDGTWRHQRIRVPEQPGPARGTVRPEGGEVGPAQDPERSVCGQGHRDRRGNGRAGLRRLHRGERPRRRQLHEHAPADTGGVNLGAGAGI